MVMKKIKNMKKSVIEFLKNKNGILNYLKNGILKNIKKH
jgi:hypothetical protein